MSPSNRGRDQIRQRLKEDLVKPLTTNEKNDQARMVSQRIPRTSRTAATVAPDTKPCPLPAHDCTGTDMTCPCGFVFRVPRFSISIDVVDGRTQVINDIFSTDSIGAIERALRDAADKVGDYVG